MIEISLYYFDPPLIISLRSLTVGSPKGDLFRVKILILFAHVALRQPPLGGLGAVKRAFFNIN